MQAENEDLANAYNQKNEELLKAEEIIQELDKRFGKQKEGITKRHKKVLKDKERDIAKLKNEV